VWRQLWSAGLRRPTQPRPYQRVQSKRSSLSIAEEGHSQTRTSNLLIDVIAHSGRYSSNAASGRNTTNPLANFVVEGEIHYWIHVAIDRFTGQVIDKQIEVVNE
jgi:hypothetical protein